MTLGEPLLNRDQAYGAVALIVSLAVAVLYLVSLFSSYLALPAWLTWWAIALPVILAVLALLTICMWIGWVMLTTPPPPLESPAQTSQPKIEDE
jgi:fatty acid desaturase